MITTIYPFTTENNYTFDSNKIEIVSGKATLKSQLPNDSLLHCSYPTSSLNANWSRLNGDIEPSSSNVLVVDGKLDFKNTSGKYCVYNTTNNFGLNTGCIRFDYIPNYNGSAPTTYWIFDSVDGGTSNSLRCWIAGSAIGVTITDNNSSIIFNGDFGPSGITILGQTYTIEVNYNLSSHIQLFIDGVDKGSQPCSGARSNQERLIIGNYYGFVSLQNSEIDNITTFGSIQHTETHDLEPSLPVTIYLTDNPSITINNKLNIEALEYFLGTSTTPSDSEIKHIMICNGVKKYHDGIEWVVSDGSYLQSNLISEIYTNKATLIEENTKTTFTIESFLHSEDGNDIPALDELEIGYDFSAAVGTVPVCIVWSYLRDLSGEPIPGATIELNMNMIYSEFDESNSVFNKTVSTTSRVDGYFELPVIKNTVLLNRFDDVEYIFKIGIDPDYETIKVKTIPDVDFIEFNDLELI